MGLLISFLISGVCCTRSAGRTMTKGVVLDKVVNTLHRRGLDVKRGTYIKDFIFDAVVEMLRRRTSVIEVLSFASGQKNWAPVEHDAGPFLYAIQELHLPGIAVVQPPSESKRNGAATSYQPSQSMDAQGEDPDC